MKTSTILFLVGSIVIIGGGTMAFMLVTKPIPATIQPATEVTATTTKAEADTTSGSASILSLMTATKGKSMECTFVFSDSGTRSEGTGFFIDGKARVDTLSTDNQNMQTASYMIMDTPADTMYVWSLVDGEQTGMKLSISANEKMTAKLSAATPAASPTAQPGTTPEPLSPLSDVQYTCKSWSPDTTVFIPPTDVQFTDMNEMDKMMGEMMEGMTLPPTQ